MSDKLQDDVKLAENEVISFSGKLKSTREDAGMSVQEAASRLHLSPRFISMLESENLLQCTLPLIYLRGYLRSYTRLLAIPEKELAQVLEKLDPKPVLEDPQPATSDSWSFSFPLENHPYYTRLASVLMALALFTSLTTWWYMHANTPTQTLISLKETPRSLESSPPGPTLPQETPAPLHNAPLETAAKNPEIEQTNMPKAAIDLPVKRSMNLANAAPVQNISTIVAKPIAKTAENDDDGADEQE